jgi:hypothetical protein
VNGQNLPSSGFDRYRRFHHTFECGNAEATVPVPQANVSSSTPRS